MLVTALYKIVFLLLCFVNLSFSQSNIVSKFEFREDKSHKNIAPQLHPKSHINIFLPSIPYSYIAKATNSGLIRSYDNEQTWVYELAKSHERVDDLTYIFELRQNLKFQNGEDFTMEDVIYNLNYFKKHPFLYTNIDKIDFDVTPLDKYRFKIVLKQKYEMFLTDLARIYFYTKEYLDTYKPIGKETGTANKAAGAFGMGPYILKEGFAVGESQTQKLELEANPYYWNKEFPKIKSITAYMEYDIDIAIEDITKSEGKLDFVPIPFNKKLDIILSPNAKLIVSKSTDNFVIFFNLINGNKSLQDKNIRQALNQALNQENLLNFVYKKEGKISPFTASLNYSIVNKIAKNYTYEETKMSEDEIFKHLKGLKLNIFTQDKFMFLLKGIEFQLKKYGVVFNYKITNSEKDIYKQLLNTNTNKNTQDWDLLVWGDDDWYYQNPWTVFFIYEENSAWSTIGKDDLMQEYIEKYFVSKVGTKEYEELTKNILYRAKDMAYTLSVPSPNKVIAVNKELIYTPYQGGIIPLWEMQISNNHWSLRDEKEYDENSKKSMKAQRIIE